VPLITTTALPTATQGVAYSFAPASTGGVAPETWAATGLPPGITFGPATPPSVFGGTPTTAGTYSVVLTVTDANKNVGTATLPLVVATAAPPIIVTTALTNATVGIAYSFHVLSSGGIFNSGITPWAATGLPAGLSINSATGVISGTPTAVGTSSVVLTVTDSNKHTATATLPLVVNPAPAPGSFTITLT
jgi:hypothetical protein